MLDKIIEVIGCILALSVASERLVEIIKGFIPSISKELDDPRQEGYRRSFIQILAVISGMFTAFLAKESIPININNSSLFVLGLLASGGSGFWNAILTYVLGVKNLKKGEVESLPPA